MLPPAQMLRFGKGGTITPFGPAGVKITGVRAEHASELVWRNPASNKDEVHYGGEPVGYVIEMENGFKVWHMGDTGLFGDMRMLGEKYKPDLVLVPIGGAYTMDASDAAIAVRDMIRPKYALPIHFDTAPGMYGTPAQFEVALGNAPGTPRMLVVSPGQKVEF
jgi:L-ascorbate metabolism protein UlaG (beta-lactamase superfamily)